MDVDPSNFAGQILCHTDDLAETRARDITVVNGEERHAIMVVDWEGVVRAFVNSCPHTRVPLNLIGDRFFDRTGNFLLCATHGAHFRPNDGFCTRGPCRGKRLTPFPVKVKDGNVIVDFGTQ